MLAFPLSTAFFSQLLVQKPYKNRDTTYLEIMNEAAIWFLIQAMHMYFHEFHAQDQNFSYAPAFIAHKNDFLKDFVGYYIIVILGVNVGVNIMAVVRSSILDTIAFYNSY